MNCLGEASSPQGIRVISIQIRMEKPTAVLSSRGWMHITGVEQVDVLRQAGKCFHAGPPWTGFFDPLTASPLLWTQIRVSELMMSSGARSKISRGTRTFGPDLK